jgi:hypothetical protein
MAVEVTHQVGAAHCPITTRPHLQAARCFITTCFPFQLHAASSRHASFCEVHGLHNGQLHPPPPPPGARAAAQAARFFVNETRFSARKFADVVEEDLWLIHNDRTVFSGKHSSPDDDRWAGAWGGGGGGGGGGVAGEGGRLRMG